MKGVCTLPFHHQGFGSQSGLEVRALGPSRGWRLGFWVPVGAGVQGFGSRTGLEFRALGPSQGWS